MEKLIFEENGKEHVGHALAVDQKGYRLQTLAQQLAKDNLHPKKKAYLERISRVLQMDDLSKVEGHPIKMILDEILYSDYYKDFDIVVSPEVVGEFETFDLFNFAEDHVARRPSDSYFIKKTDNKKDSVLLRPHTSVMRYYYLLKYGGKEKLYETGEVAGLSKGKVYRVDTIDSSHHECFHQIDGLRITSKEKEIIDQSTLREVLTETIQLIFGESVEIKFDHDVFPYTVDSLQARVKIGDEWLEVLGAGVVNPTVLEKLGIDSEKYNGRAYGFGIERLAMALKGIPDIRLFWSKDERVINQWGELKDQYEHVSKFPPVLKDISCIVPSEKFIIDEQESETSGKIELTRESEADLFEVAGICRDVGGDLIEGIQIFDIYESSSFGEGKKSLSFQITFRSLERTLTNDEINSMYHETRERLKKELGYELRG